MLDLDHNPFRLDQNRHRLHIGTVLKRFFHLFLLVFAMLGMAGQAAASNPCSTMAMDKTAVMSMTDCNEIHKNIGSSQNDDILNCNDMLQCSPVPVAQFDNDIFVSQSPMLNEHIPTIISAALPEIMSAPEFKPPKPSIA